jgi:four helix bundle protein
MRRCSVSIPSNIAEGYRRKSQNEFYRFLSISFGSGAELETQVEISKRLNFVNDNKYYKIEIMLNEIMKMLNKMLNNKKA